ncbi:LacI family DNA-binding transcriptional regulator [Agreia sp. PsM10]|uniref:LacI family DNA-binding transcriptional regulator n=1 Tax=Agreia sp. PsM10 TaxID=3030533 RepID=UPI00263B5699|nr:LacI family DNA-binding transcriptional regulator [Agreia sp. PsM10]MDN4639115.1 LacI family DNA-binding transcriptional regulator [Agreia sp. PsM10]
MAITLHDVARMAGVSIKTVSNVINDYPHIRPTTRTKVEAAISELGYQPNLSARSLRSGRSGVISLLIPDLRNAYFAELADAVMRAAQARGLSVIIEQMPGGKKEELEILRGPRMQLVDGILYSVLALGEEDAHELDSRMPMVLLGDRIFHGPKDHVTMQNTAGAKAATEHLLSLGRRRIAALGSHPGEVVGSAGLRLDGYRQALDEAGVAYDPSLVIPAINWHRKDGAAAMRRFLEQDVPFDGLVAFNDSMALGAMRVMQEAGLRIPDDVSVIGFDDIDETRYSIPSLSTIDPSKDEIAETAVDLLLERIENPDSDVPARDLATVFRVVQRESSAR